MQESFLHFIWQFQYFEQGNLKTDSGEEIQIIAPGFSNSNAGPDFSQAKIMIGQIEWVGNVEIHVKSSDWKSHNHSEDEAYENVILHVVWENNFKIHRNDNSTIPTLSLNKRVDKEIFGKYETLIQGKEAISCSSQFSKVNRITKLSMFDKALMSRLERKAENVLELLARSQYDWEQTAFKVLAQSFGFKINNEPFLQLANAIHIKTLIKHSDQLLQIEALLFGQAGFLDANLEDDYFQKLKSEYHFLSKKYNLQATKLELHQWKFMRLRPPNFPTLRIAQLATFIYTHKSIFSKLILTNDVKELQKLFDIKQSAYWQKHHQFGKKSKRSSLGIGKGSAEILLINTVAPILVAYDKYKDQEKLTTRAITLLESLKPENNRITKLWKAIGQPVRSAFDSQASIELFNNYCSPKKCLECNIGVALVRK